LRYFSRVISYLHPFSHKNQSKLYPFSILDQERSLYTIFPSDHNYDNNRKQFSRREGYTVLQEDVL